MAAQVSDLKREISLKYNVLSEDGVALRGLFLIDREVRLQLCCCDTPQQPELRPRDLCSRGAMPCACTSALSRYATLR